MKNKDVQDEVNRILDAVGVPLSEISAAYSGGAVRLSGKLDSLQQREKAMELTRKVIRDTDTDGIPIDSCENVVRDASLKSTIEDSLRNCWFLPHQKIRVEVSSGKVVLEGALRWKCQKTKAVGIARKTVGITTVTDRITILPRTGDVLERAAVEEGLKNNWALEDCRITVGVDTDTVYLSGTVSSPWQKKQAERIAWRVPGVWNVINDLVVDY